MSVNKVILVGNVGRDPEVKYLDNNKVVAKFSIATNESYRDRNGNNVDQTEWHNIEMWDDLAKIVEKYVKKGKLLYVEGKIKTNKWTDRETNQERQNKFIRGTSFNFLGTGRDEESNEGGGESSYNKGNDNGGGNNNQNNNNYNNSSNNSSSNKAPANDPAPAPEPMPDDDLPF